MDVFTTADLLSQGLSPKMILRLVEQATLLRVSRGFYQAATTDEHPPELIHLARAEVCRGAVLAWESAALVHGLPLLRPVPDLVQVVEDGDGRSWRRGLRQIRNSAISIAQGRSSRPL